MKRNKYINTFDTTSQYDAYIESAAPGFPNVALTEDDGAIHYRTQSPNDYQIWGTTTATSNFNIKLNGNNVEVTVDTMTGEFYLQGWTGTLTSMTDTFQNLSHITSIKKFNIDTSNVTSLGYSTGSGCFNGCTNLKTLNLSGCTFTCNPTYKTFYNCTSITDIYITEESTLMSLTNNLTSQDGGQYPMSSATIHYNGTDYTWSGSAWTAQS